MSDDCTHSVACTGRIERLEARMAQAETDLRSHSAMHTQILVKLESLSGRIQLIAAGVGMFSGIASAIATALILRSLHA